MLRSIISDLSMFHIIRIVAAGVFETMNDSS